MRTAALALLAGIIGVVGAVYTARSFALNRAGQLTDRFTKAIEQLGHQELDVRLGGIYALERIARDSKEDHTRSRLSSESISPLMQTGSLPVLAEAEQNQGQPAPVLQSAVVWLV